MIPLVQPAGEADAGGQDTEADHVTEGVDLDAEGLLLIGGVFSRPCHPSVKGIQAAGDHEADDGQGNVAAIEGHGNADDRADQGQIGKNNSVMIIT